MGRDQHAARTNGAAVFSWTRLGAALVQRASGGCAAGSHTSAALSIARRRAREGEWRLPEPHASVWVGIAISQVKQLGRAKTAPLPCPSRRSALQGLSGPRPGPPQPISGPVCQHRRSGSCAPPHLLFAPICLLSFNLTFSWASHSFQQPHLRPQQRIS